MTGFDFDAYQALVIDPARLGDAAATYHLESAPCISRPEAYCQSVSLQVAAEWRAVRNDPIDHYNWLMGFTYGAGHLKGSLIFLPFTDPEAGLRLSAPSLGLTHRYHVTDDADVYQRAIKAALSSGHLLRVMVDSATLRGRDDYVSPHSILLVGYDREVARFYETRAPSLHERGVPGQPLSWELLARAARRIGQLYRYPWALQFTEFGHGPHVELDVAATWQRNGQLLIGQDDPWTASGSHALLSLGAELRREPARGSGDLQVFIEYGVYTRRDNASYLDGRSADHPTLARAAQLLKQSSGCYERMLGELQGQSPTLIQTLATELERAAELERLAGEALCRCASEWRRSEPDR